MGRLTMPGGRCAQVRTARRALPCSGPFSDVTAPLTPSMATGTLSCAT
jgi:hypothetical protein